MPDVIEAAPSGRAKCRGCGRAVAKGELRYGEALPNPYAEGESLHWFHVSCAALMRPDHLLPLLVAFPGDPAERALLEATCVEAQAFPRIARIVRAEHASSGRAACRHCREPIAKGSLRIALQLFEEGRMVPIGTLHATCAPSYFGTRDVLARIVRLTPELPEADVAALRRTLAECPLVPAWNAGTEGSAEPEVTAGATTAEGPGAAPVPAASEAANAGGPGPARAVPRDPGAAATSDLAGDAAEAATDATAGPGVSKTRPDGAPASARKARPT